VLPRFETSYSNLDRQIVVASVDGPKVVEGDYDMIALLNWDNLPSMAVAYEEACPALRRLPSAAPLANHPYLTPHPPVASSYQMPAASGGLHTSSLAHHQIEGTGGGPCRRGDAVQYIPGVVDDDAAAAAVAVEDVVADARQSARDEY